MENLQRMDNLTIANQRQQLKDERKIRNKQKREIKKTEKRKEREKLDLIYTIRPQGANVSLITHQFANYAKGLQSTGTIKTEALHLTDTDFPLIGDTQKIVSTNKNVHTVDSGLISIVKNETKKSSSKAINVNLMDLIQSEKQIPVDANVKTVPNETIYNGNRLDSSMPVRKKGKNKEQTPVKRDNKFKSCIKQDQLSLLTNKPDCYFLYQDNVVTSELENATEIFLTKLVHFQERLYQKNQLKGQIKKRYVVGFHEVKKYFKVNKIRVLIIATNIKVLKENDTLHSTIKEITDIANNLEVDYFFALSRRKLGVITLKHVPISCIGIFNYDGAQEEYKIVQNEVKKAKEEYISCNETSNCLENNI